MDITVSNEFKITSDGMQLVLKRLKTIDPTKSPQFDPDKHSTEVREEWYTWKYCGNIDQALGIIAHQKLLESDATSLKQLQKEIKSFKKYLEGLFN